METRNFNPGRWFALACLLGLTFGLGGCGGGDGTTGTAAGTVASGGSGSGGSGSGSGGGSGGSGGSGSGGGNSLAQRALPAILTSTSTKAVNYSPYRTAGGPNVGEIPTDAQISQDLTLLSNAGFTLLRLFDTDTAHANVLRVAAASFPNLKFQLGMYLQGIAPASQATCSNTANDTDVQNGIALANKYSNVVAVSVGNETSFFAAYMPINCLKGYITTAKQGVTQPVTADDDWSFYAGIDGGTEVPDTLLPLLDYVSMHTYALSNWQTWTGSLSSSGTATQRATNLMNGALINSQSTYTQVKNYVSAHGGAALPITIGEIGWKHTPTNPQVASTNCLPTSSGGPGGGQIGAGNPVEGNGAVATCDGTGKNLVSVSGATAVAATPINAKWFYDLLNGWQSGGTGPQVIFWFEGTDEVWKGADDGWGFWDSARTPQLALCATAGAPTTGCPAAGTYPGAGYYP